MLQITGVKPVKVAGEGRSVAVKKGACVRKRSSASSAFARAGRLITSMGSFTLAMIVLAFARRGPHTHTGIAKKKTANGLTILLLRRHRHRHSPGSVRTPVSTIRTARVMMVDLEQRILVAAWAPTVLIAAVATLQVHRPHHDLPVATLYLLVVIGNFSKILA